MELNMLDCVSRKYIEQGDDIKPVRYALCKG